MNRSIPENYRVSDFLSWFRNDRLRLNPNFQRGSVWTSDARSYLIETVLRGYPMPKIYMRTVIDLNTQEAIRDIVDGQQRLRTLFDFAAGRFRPNRRAGDLAGLTYAELSREQREDFLAYAISVEQLIGATDDDVLEVFARLNTYTVPLNPPEKRHAKYQGEFKFAVRNLSQSLSWFWEKYSILSTRNRVRMLDDQLVAEMFGVLLGGVDAGGAVYLDRLYSTYDEAFERAQELSGTVNQAIEVLDEDLGDVLRAGFFSRPPQLLMLFAAIAHSRWGIPPGALGLEQPAQRTADYAAAVPRLLELTDVVAEENPPTRFVPFVNAAGGATTRMSTRKPRFLFTYRALVGA